MFRLAVKGVGAGLKTAWWVGSTTRRAISLLPPYRRAEGVVLDTLLGPAESFEYVSKTAPSSPPRIS